MEKFMKEIYELINTKNLSIRGLAKETGVSKSVISDGLAGKTEMKLDSFLPIILKIYENRDERRQKINEIIMLCESDLNIRKSLCYCQCSGEYEVMQKLIEKHSSNPKEQKDLSDQDEEKNTGSQGLEKYLGIYELYNKRNSNKLSGQALLDVMDKKDFSNDAECQILLNILYGLAMYDIPNYRAMIPYSTKIENYLHEVGNEYIRTCLQMQYRERIAYLNLLDNDIDNCREVCEQILKSELDFPIIKASALCCLGESYMLGDDYDILKAERYLKKAIRLLEDSGISKGSKKYFAFKTTLAFLYIEYGFNTDKIDFEYIDIGELAYYECKFGNKDKGLAMFRKLEKDSNLSAIRLYYLSRIKNDVLLTKKSLEKFEKNGNLYYVQLVKRTLINEGVK